VTKQLPEGTLNQATNWYRDSMQLMKRHLFQMDTSWSDFARIAVIEKLDREAPEIAAQVRAIESARRERHKSQPRRLRLVRNANRLAALSVLTIAAYIFGASDMRPIRTARVLRPTMTRTARRMEFDL